MWVNFIGEKNNKPILVGKTLLNPANFPNYPCQSSNIQIVIGNEWSNQQSVELENVGKAMGLPFNGSMYFILLRHSMYG